MTPIIVTIVANAYAAVWLVPHFMVILITVLLSCGEFVMLCTLMGFLFACQCVEFKHRRTIHCMVAQNIFALIQWCLHYSTGFGPIPRRARDVLLSSSRHGRERVRFGYPIRSQDVRETHHDCSREKSILVESRLSVACELARNTHVYCRTEGP